MRGRGRKEKMYDRTLDPCVPVCERTKKEERKKKNWKNSVEETKAKGNAEETRQSSLEDGRLVDSFAKVCAYRSCIP